MKNCQKIKEQRKKKIQNFSGQINRLKGSDALFMVNYPLTFAQNSLYWQV